MACMTEALGLSLPGCATAHAVDVKKARIAHESGKRIVELVKKNLKPLDIVSQASFENAIRLDMTIGGSTNTVLHLTAIAAEGDISLGLDDFDRISGKTPHLCNMGPAGQYTMKDLDEAGGIPAVLGQIKGLNNAPTVSGKNLGEIAKAAKVLNSEVIRPADNPSTRQVASLSCTATSLPTARSSRAARSPGICSSTPAGRRSLTVRIGRSSPSSAAKSGRATSRSFAAAGRRAVPACRKCSALRRPSQAWG
jgi:dihydroxyacid dehydratase/phosphogluconate dehydratase